MFIHFHPRAQSPIKIILSYGVGDLFMLIAVIFVPTRVKLVLPLPFILEQVCFSIAYHPWTKKMMNLTTSTALNIEHEVERFSLFVTIAIGEFYIKLLHQVI